MIAFVTDDAQSLGLLRANEWVNDILTHVGGRGGGRAGFAQGSASVSEEQLQSVIAYAESLRTAAQDVNAQS